jgi:4-hydroxy-tetrahydrodipicolinate reductase
MAEHGSKRVVVYGTGFVGKMVIAEIVKHPLFELVGVGVSNPDKVGRDVGEICGLPEPVGVTATDDIGALIALKPDALVHYGPTAMHAKENISLITRFLRAGIDVCSTAMTPWVWPTMSLNPPNWIQPITEACELGESSCFTTGIDPGFANDLFPMTLMGLCSEVRRVRASELLDYTNYEGDYEFEMGIGREPEFKPMLEDRDMLIFAWGATVPMIAHAAGIMLDEITTTWDKWVTPTERNSARDVIKPGHVARSGSPSTASTRVRPASSSNMSTGSDWTPPPTGRRATTTTSTAWTSRAPRASSRRPRSASPTVRAGTRPRPAAWRPACGHSMPFPRSTTCGRVGSPPSTSR